MSNYCYHDDLYFIGRSINELKEIETKRMECELDINRTLKAIMCIMLYNSRTSIPGGIDYSLFFSNMRESINDILKSINNNH